ncbi:poly(ADP-ribose) glycohydrolase [Kipferlia bialata]|uniref:Poly(ADP-ribose) glycohydrolase n=1 Tax=Kipferlia bialata TaxID=797122 RepID=A0A9K3CTS5_9EUKA|nr:poly(ADP-ribose) glycohydrolase [Kipferlia bialata]|eukprot:g3368.t1
MAKKPTVCFSDETYARGMEYLSTHSLTSWAETQAYYRHVVGYTPETASPEEEIMAQCSKHDSPSIDDGCLYYLWKEADADKDAYIQSTLATIVSFAQGLGDLYPVDKDGRRHMLEVSPDTCVMCRASTICSLLAADFLFALDYPQDQPHVPRSVFRTLLSSPADILVEKVQFILSYFHTMGRMRDEGLLDGYVVVHRATLKKGKDKNPVPLVVLDEGAGIEKDGASGGVVMADFANEWIGGGARSRGCVQEEILFLLYPELYATMLVSPTAMGDREAIHVSGMTRTGIHSGYGWDTKYVGPYKEQTPLKTWGGRPVRDTHLTAFDALMLFSLSQKKGQLRPTPMQREIDKATIAFQTPSLKKCILSPPEPKGYTLPPDQPLLEYPTTVITGNWGCGAFGGNRGVKLLVQVVAAAKAGLTKVVYCPFSATELMEGQALLDHCHQGKITASQLQDAIESARRSNKLYGTVECEVLFPAVLAELAK